MSSLIRISSKDKDKQCSNMQHQSQSYSQQDRMQYQMERSMQNDVWELGTGITALSGEGGSGKTQICFEFFCHLCNDNDTVAISFIWQHWGFHCCTTILNHFITSWINSEEFVESLLPKIYLPAWKSQYCMLSYSTISRYQPASESTANKHWSHRAFDGIAGCFRLADPTYQHTKDSMFHFQHSSKLFTVSSQLRQLSDVYNVPMLTTNQVAAAIPPIAASGGSETLPTDTSQEQLVIVYCCARGREFGSKSSCVCYLLPLYEISLSFALFVAIEHHKYSRLCTVASPVLLDHLPATPC